jgi:hypothetical protein
VLQTVPAGTSGAQAKIPAKIAKYLILDSSVNAAPPGPTSLKEYGSGGGSDFNFKQKV